ncbi:MAG: exo-alpha-sialidase, partial [Clostridia bacterium]|nr:exo-alpha-sialidase [Clostridia bacterium]
MIPHMAWSYSPYRPLLRDTGGIYISRIVPEQDSIHIEWLPAGGEQEYSLYIGEPDGELAFVGTTPACEYTFACLAPDRDYCLKVSCSDSTSRVRLARCGNKIAEGVTVNYLHPQDEAYSFSGRYLCSPSLVRAPQGHLLASMDMFAPNAPQNLTMIFRSDDDGQSWHYVCELFPCFWGKLFVHRGRLYMLGVSTEYGDLLIGASDDGGYTFTPPVVLWRGACHSGEDGIHKNPQPVVEYAGRIWNTCEWGCWAHGTHAAMVFSCDAEADLLDPLSWRFTPPLPYNPAWPGTAEGKSAGTIEGTLAVLPDGMLYNIMRYDMMRCRPDYGSALA